MWEGRSSRDWTKHGMRCHRPKWAGIWALGSDVVEGGARAGKWADDFFFLKKSNQGPLTIALVFSPLSLYIYFYLYIYIYIPIK